MSLAKNAAPLLAAQAGFYLSSVLSRRNDFSGALAATDRALSYVAKNVGAADLLVPTLLAQRTWLLAALDRREDAQRELDTLASAHPSYPGIAANELGVRLLLALRAGDLAAARSVAAQRVLDMPLSVHAELLADVVAVTGDASPIAAEVARLSGELDADPEIRAWLRHAWPDAERELDEARGRAKGKGARVAVEGAETEPDAAYAPVIGRSGPFTAA